MMMDINIDNVTASLLYYLPDRFANKKELMHETFYKFQQRNEYKALLKDLWFINCLSIIILVIILLCWTEFLLDCRNQDC